MKIMDLALMDENNGVHRFLIFLCCTILKNYLLSLFLLFSTEKLRPKIDALKKADLFEGIED